MKTSDELWMPSETSAPLPTLGMERIADHIRPVCFGVQVEAVFRAASAHLSKPPMLVVVSPL